MKAHYRLLVLGSAAILLYVAAQAWGAAVAWQPPAPLHDDAASDAFEDGRPHVVASATGAWLAVWVRSQLSPTEESGILAGRWSSEDETWNVETLFWSTESDDEGVLGPPRAATDGQGAWIVVWQSADTLNETIGSDHDIVYVVSTDDGLAWSEPAALNWAAPFDIGWDNIPDIAADGAGTWVATWSSLGRGVVAARSVNNGATWSRPTEFGLSSSARKCPRIASDGGDVWIIAYATNATLDDTIGSDSDIVYLRSLDDGLTWSPIGPLNTNAATDTGEDGGGLCEGLALASDGVSWLAVWPSNEDLDGAGTDYDLFCARSLDNGLTWQPPILLNSYAAQDGPADSDCRWGPPQLASDGTGGWMAAWPLEGTLGGALVQSRTVMAAASEDGGLTWGEAAPVDANAYIADDGEASWCSIATDSNYLWRVVWESTDTLDGLIGEDLDILVAETLYPPITLTVSPLARYVPPPAGQTSFDVSAGGLELPWHAELTSGADWLTLLTTDGQTPGTITLSFLPNTGMAERIGVLEVSMDLAENSPVEVQVVQDGNSPRTDINRDGTVNAIDVQLVINAALGLDIGRYKADVNQDNGVNALDVQQVINAALGL